MWLSMYGMRAVIALQEKGVKYEYQEEDLSNKTDLLSKMNPVYKKVPVLIHNGKPICESFIIVQYIDETWGSEKLLPTNPYDRALARFWADFVDKKILEPGFRIVWSIKDKAEEAKRDLLDNFKILEGVLKEMSAGGSLPFFGGKDFGFLDIAFIPCVSWFGVYETIGNFKIPFESEYPLIDAWVKRCMERDSVKNALPSRDRAVEHVLEMKKRYL